MKWKNQRNDCVSMKIHFAILRADRPG